MYTFVLFYSSKIKYPMNLIWQILLASNSFVRHTHCSIDYRYNRTMEHGEVEQLVGMTCARTRPKNSGIKNERYKQNICDGDQHTVYTNLEKIEEMRLKDKRELTDESVKKDVLIAHSSNSEQKTPLLYQSYCVYTSKDLEVNDEKLPDEIFADTNDITPTEKASDTCRTIDELKITGEKNNMQPHSLRLFDSNLSRDDIRNAEATTSANNGVSVKDEQARSLILKNDANITANQVLKPARDKTSLSYLTKKRRKSCETYIPAKVKRINAKNVTRLEQSTTLDIDTCISGNKQPKSKKKLGTLGNSTANEPNPSTSSSSEVPIQKKITFTQKSRKCWVEDLSVIFCNSVMNRIFSISSPIEHKSSTYQTETNEIVKISLLITNRAVHLLLANRDQYLLYSSSLKKKINIFHALEPKVKKTLNSLAKSPNEIDLFANTSEWERDELPKILEGLKKVNRRLTKSPIVQTFIMILEQEIDLAAFFQAHKKNCSINDYNISMFMGITKRLFDSKKSVSAGIYPGIKFSYEHMDNLVRYFLRILKEKQRCLKMKLLPELFSLQHNIYQSSGKFCPLKASSLMIIFSLSNLHHMLKCIEKQIWYNTEELINVQVLSIVLFMREILIVALIRSFNCEEYVINTYIWLTRMEYHVLLTNFFVYANNADTLINPFIAAFFYFFFVAHFHGFAVELLDRTIMYDKNTIKCLIVQLSTFCLPYFDSYNVPLDFYSIRSTHQSVYNQIQTSFYTKSHYMLYCNVNTAFNYLKQSSDEEITSFLQEMIFSVTENSIIQ